MTNLDPFKNQQYLSVETFRKNGEWVKTPVWFVELNQELCIATGPQSGKIKRIRNNPSVQVAPCKMDGTITGEWKTAKARFMQGVEIQQMEKLYNKKYGVMKFLFELPLLFKKVKPERAIIAVTLD
jgi:PPOX class probable F420-dependent enzyme